MGKNDTLIKINQLYKIFGDDQVKALELVKNGISKEELLEKSNCVLGLNNINLNIKKSKNTSCYGAFWIRKIYTYTTS